LHKGKIKIKNVKQGKLHITGLYMLRRLMEVRATKLRKQPERFLNGTIVPQGDIGHGTFYYTPTTIQLTNWKSPNKQIKTNENI
jgi:hypothetical protein